MAVIRTLQKALSSFLQLDSPNSEIIFAKRSAGRDEGEDEEVKEEDDDEEESEKLELMIFSAARRTSALW
jgi:hypothetical protein